MLTELLRWVAQGGVHSMATLAHELGVSEALLDQMTRDLVRLGYLKSVTGGCEGGCNSCPLAGGCLVSRTCRLWSLTEKGMQTADSARPKAYDKHS
jgi:hypothetical protein